MNGLEVQWGRSRSRHVWQGLTRIQVMLDLNFWIEFSDVLDGNILQLENLHHVDSSWMGIRILWGKSVKVILDIDVGIQLADVFDVNMLQLENLHHVDSSWMGIRILILDIDVGIEFANVLKTMFNVRIPLMYVLNMGNFVNVSVVLLHHVVQVGVFYHPWREEIIVVQFM
jgi:hypothetical protein